MDPSFPDHASLANLPLMEELYQKYLKDPSSIDSSWRYFFEGMDFSYASSQGPQIGQESQDKKLRIFILIQAYRKFGHLAAHIDPLNLEKRPFPEELKLENLGFSSADLDKPFPTFGLLEKKEAFLKEIVAALERIYTSSIGFECVDLGRPDLEKWFFKWLETLSRPILSKQDKLRLWKSLVKAELFEQFLHRRYVGQTRFSIEGGESMLPLLLEITNQAGERGVEELMIGMAHRGRLNVLAQVLEKPYFSLLEEFENDLILSYPGSDDVKYHMGFSKKISLSSGKEILISMAPNPSHLESVDPVIIGQVKAKQIFKQDEERKKTAALLIHGDAALAGQGVIYETLQLMDLPSYTTGGTIHLVINNQIGYTTSSQEGRSTRYCTDIAKTFGCPVFHVNAEDVESCLFVAQLAVEIRQTFQCDVFIDFLCYRKYGHNEGDDPSYTQPLEYLAIHTKPSICFLYTQKLIQEGILKAQDEEVFSAEFKNMLADTLEAVKNTPFTSPSPFPSIDPFIPFPTAVETKLLQHIGSTFCEPPPSFQPHSKLKKWLQDRLAALHNDPLQPSIDWATAECLAFGSLLTQSISIRLAGQDSQRGTFSQRHLILIDEKTAAPYSPLEKLCTPGTYLHVVNTPLTEYAGMAFEYGYSESSPQTLVLWEAQYGDFYNGAQIIVDQYLISAEHKWNARSSLVLLLPHAYEGAGPEHSSARLERFLQLAAENNIQVVNASTPSQYFHLLRRQALGPLKKPLILFTPKSLLRSPANLSPLNDFTSKHFEEILDDPTPPKTCTKILFCSGKIFYELYAEKMKRNLTNLAIIRIEQIYPFHHQKLNQILAQYKCQQYFWVQEEPENAGAWNFVRSQMDRPLLYIGRPSTATTATGSHKKHKQEQQAIIEQAVGALPQAPPKG